MTERCKPGQLCENERRYYQTDFSRPTSESLVDPTAAGQDAPVPRGEEKRDPTVGGRLTRPLRPTIKDLTQSQMEKARMVKASKIAYEESFTAAQSYIDKQGIPYDIDTALSSKESLVLLGYVLKVLCESSY